MIFAKLMESVLNVLLNGLGLILSSVTLVEKVITPPAAGPMLNTVLVPVQLRVKNKKINV